MSSNRPVIDIRQSFSSIYDAFYFSNDPEKMLRPKKIQNSEYGPYKIELRDFGAKAGSVSGIDLSQAEKIALEMTGGQDRQLTTRTVNTFLREAMAGVERETQGGALSAMTGYVYPKGNIGKLDYSKRTRPISLVFGNPGDDVDGKNSAGHWQSGSFKVWVKNQSDVAYGRSYLGDVVRHETGHVVSSGIEQNVRILSSDIANGRAGSSFSFLNAAGQKILPPLEDETLRYSWMRQQILSSYRKDAVQPSHISEMIFKAMEQNARTKYLRRSLFIAANSSAFATTKPNRKFIEF